MTDFVEFVALSLLPVQWWRDIVALLRDGRHTGALPGRLLRGPLARRA